MDTNKNKKTEIDTLQRSNKVEVSSSDLKGEALSNVLKVVESLANKPGTSGTANTSSSGKSTAKMSASKRRYRDRRSASRILDKLAATPEEQLTLEQRQSLTWAKATVGCDKIEPKDSNPKRVRSVDEDEAVDSKRAKVKEGASPKAVKLNKSPKLYTEVLKEHVLVLAVVDRGQEDGSITMGRWNQVYDALNEVFIKVLGENPGPPPSCRDVGWHQGRVKLTACADSRSAALFRKAIEEVGEVWPGARLAAVGREEIPSRPRARVWLPTKPTCPEKVLDIIQASNPNLPTKNWKIVKQEEAKGNYRQAVMVINSESLAPLAKTKGVINFGFGSITLKVYKKDDVVRGPVNRPDDDNGSKPTGAEGADTHPLTEAMEMDLILGMDSLLPLDSDEDSLLDTEEEEGANSSAVERGASEDKRRGVGVLEGTSHERKPAAGSST